MAVAGGHCHFLCSGSLSRGDLQPPYLPKPQPQPVRGGWTQLFSLSFCPPPPRPLGTENPAGAREGWQTREDLPTGEGVRCAQEGAQPSSPRYAEEEGQHLPGSTGYMVLEQG